jgi:hypothetical protein
MAITTTTITKAAGWSRSDVIDQLEQAFTWLDLHGTQISGLVTSITVYDGGGNVGSAGTDYFDVPVATTSGIGTGATFDVYRQSGVVNQIFVNRPGYGYTDGEYVTLSADDIGGGSAVAIGITVAVDGGATPVGYGSTNAFFDKNLTPSVDSTRPWGVLKQDFDTSKRYGVTYRGFKPYSDYQMGLYAGSSFFPFDTTNTSDKGGRYRDSYRGTFLLDTSAILSGTSSQNNSLDYATDLYAQVGGQYDDLFRYATSNSPTTHDLKLNIYRSSIDTDFAVLSFNQPSVSGTLNDSTFSTFIIHNFDSVLWDYDEVFSAGVTFVVPDDSLNQTNGSTAFLGFRTLLVGNNYNLSENVLTTRTAEAGWSQIYNQTDHYGLKAQNYNVVSSQTNYTASSGSGIEDYNTPTENNKATIFSRVGFKNEGRLTEDSSTYTYGNIHPITTYTSVIKGIPINGNLIPCPYYMPDDFVLIDFKLPASGQDIKQGDTITISGSEVYTVITGSYNKNTETAGILFCARTV